MDYTVDIIRTLHFGAGLMAAGAVVGCFIAVAFYVLLLAVRTTEYKPYGFPVVLGVGMGFSLPLIIFGVCVAAWVGDFVCPFFI